MADSIHPHSRLAFYDEMEKIASRKVRPDAARSRGNLKRWVQGAVTMAAGTGAGTGAYMLAEKGAKKYFGKRWAKMKPTTKAAILGPAFTAAGLGTAYVAKKMMEKRREFDPR
jgi:hypothetical protein